MTTALYPHCGSYLTAHKGRHGYSVRGGSTRHCDYCGSLHPEDLAKYLREGTVTRLSPADRKYGWPHKFYTEPAWNKFYSEHLIDASEEDRDLISKYMGLNVNFAVDEKGLTVTWKAYVPKPETPTNAA